MRKFTIGLAEFIRRHPIWFIIVAVLISGASVPGITMLKSETGYSALIQSNDPVWVNTTTYQSEFGGDPINILLTGSMDDIFSSENLATLSQFEQGLLADPTYSAVTSPLSILEVAVATASQQAQDFQQQLTDAQDQAAQAARDQVAAAGGDEAAQDKAAELAKQQVLDQFQPQIDAFAQIGEISITNPAFVRSVLYDSSGNISSSFKQFIPDSNHALMFVIPVGNLSDADTMAATNNIESQLAALNIPGVDTTVISYIKMIDAIGTSLSGNLILLLGLSVLAMILILVFMFRVRWRLLSLGMVGISSLWTFGLMGYMGVPLTMTSMAILPILIGLGIDFSIQFHNRYQEELTRNDDAHEAILISISRMFPVVGIALFATILGFITLFISEVPMIKQFGMMLAIGIVICYIVGLFLLHSIVILADRNVPMDRLQTSARKASSRFESILFKLGQMAINHVVWIVIIAIGFAVAGGVVDQKLPINTDYESLMPQNNTALNELRDFRKIVGVGGSITFMVEADQVDTQEILTWMQNFQNDMITAYPDITGSNSPATLVSGLAGGTIPGQQQIDTIIAGVPAFSRDRVLSQDLNYGSLSFTTKYSDVESIHDLIANIRDTANPPAGVTISPVGSMVIGAKTMDAIVGSRMKMNFICLGAIFLILLLLYRRLDRTLFAVIPTGMVIAWSSLDMFLLGIPLNPLTAILGVIVIGIGTEFMVLLTGRYEEEKENGLAPKEAMVTAISRIGRAITTTSLTTLGGFGVLIVSNFPLISQFGLATLIGVILCLVITLTVMPGVIVWYDNLRLRRKKS